MYWARDVGPVCDLYKYRTGTVQREKYLVPLRTTWGTVCKARELTYDCTIIMNLLICAQHGFLRYCFGSTSLANGFKKSTHTSLT